MLIEDLELPVDAELVSIKTDSLAKAMNSTADNLHGQKV
jgi:hypothetical protein